MSQIRSLYRALFRRSANIYVSKLRFAVVWLGQIHNLDTYWPRLRSRFEIRLGTTLRLVIPDTGPESYWILAPGVETRTSWPRGVWPYQSVIGPGSNDTLVKWKDYTPLGQEDRVSTPGAKTRQSFSYNYIIFTGVLYIRPTTVVATFAMNGKPEGLCESGGTGGACKF